jgi:DDE superfamily endonuclease
MTSWMIPSYLSSLFTRLTINLDPRIQPLFGAMLIGIFCTAERRRTASSWFRGGEIGGDFRRAYNVIGSVGRNAERMATTVLLDVENSPALADEEEITFAIDDTPSKRYGPEVEGAGLHHNPTPGPSGAAFVYGHSFVTLARLTSHPEHGTRALPIRADLYVREKDIAKIPLERRWEFHTKIEMATEQLNWVGSWMKNKRKSIWAVVDGAYAKRPVLKAAKKNGIILVSRLRKDAALRCLPGKQSASKRGRKRKYGRDVISLAKRAGQKGGWQTEEMVLYGEKVTKTYKTFLATWRPADGVIRVVLVKEDHGWRAYFCTKTDATPAEILGKVAQRTSIEDTFKDLKQVWGAGQQQLRNIHANIGAWHLNLWAYTMTELWAWDKPEEQLVDRSASPWDNKPRRPSHADRRKALQRESLRQEYQAALHGPGQNEKLKQLCLRLMEVAA